LNSRLQQILNPKATRGRGEAASDCDEVVVASETATSWVPSRQQQQALTSSEYGSALRVRAAEERHQQAAGGGSLYGMSSVPSGTVDNTPDGEVLPRVGDRMIQLRNDYEQQVYNGDIGHVTRVWKEGRANRFSVSFAAPTTQATRRTPDGGLEEVARRGLRPTQLLVEYTRSALDRDIALAYALTVHKAQGAEYPVVVMPIVPQHSRMLYRNLLYTGLSRAKQLLVFVGSESALRFAVHNGAASRRVTLLAERVDDRDFAPKVTRHMSPEE